MKVLFTGVLLLLAYCGFAQESVLKFTDYGVTQPLINPSVMGVEPGVNGLLLYRSRFEKSDIWPSMGAFNINSMIKDKNLGGGISVIFDKYGPYQKLLAYLAGSYRLKVNEGKSLFFGLQAGINYVTNSNKYDPYHKEETIFAENYSQPNFGFGLLFKTDQYYVGLSIPEFQYNTIDENGSKINDMVSEMIRIYLYGGYRFKLNENLSLDPYLYLVYSEFEGAQMDLGGKLTYKESLQFGAQYRTKESFAVLARVRLLDQIWLGYSFEGSTSVVDNSFNSLQEITLTFRFGKKSESKTSSFEEKPEDSINSIRYF